MMVSHIHFSVPENSYDSLRRHVVNKHTAVEIIPLRTARALLPDLAVENVRALVDEDGLAVGAVAMDPDVGAARGRASARPSAASEDGRRPDQGARVGWHLAVCFSSIKFYISTSSTLKCLFGWEKE